MVRRVVLLAVIRVPSVGIVGRDHEGLLHASMEVLGRAALCQNDALNETCQEGTACPLFRLRACLFVVEDGKHLRHSRRSFSALQQSLQSGMNHAEVVESSAGNELVVNAEGAGRRCVGQVEVEVEDVFLSYLQFIANQVDKEVSLLQFVVDDAEDGEHVLLLAELNAVVHLSVEVDGEVADLQEGPPDMQELGLRMHDVGGTDFHSSGNLPNLA